MLGKRRYTVYARGLRVKKVELKLETLTGGVLQSAFNNFAKFTVKHLRWSLFKKVAGLMVSNFFKKKTLAQVFSCMFSEIFRKTYFAEHAERILGQNEPKKL